MSRSPSIRCGTGPSHRSMSALAAVTSPPSAWSTRHLYATGRPRCFCTATTSPMAVSHRASWSYSYCRIVDSAHPAASAVTGHEARSMYRCSAAMRNCSSVSFTPGVPMLNPPTSASRLRSRHQPPHHLPRPGPLPARLQPPLPRAGVAPSAPPVPAAVAGTTRTHPHDDGRRTRQAAVPCP